MSKRGRRRGTIAIGSYELDLGALAQAFARPGCIALMAALILLLVVAGLWHPWEMLRGRGAVIVQAPERAKWTLEGIEGRGSATVQVRAGKDTLKVEGGYYLTSASVTVGKNMTTTVVIADALQWLSGESYSGTVVVAWPKPTILNLPKEVRRVQFPSKSSEMVYEARAPYESWRTYLLDENGQVSRLSWIEALGGPWALAPDGRALFARNNQVGVAENLADITTVYSTTSSAAVTDLYRLKGSWVVMLNDSVSRGYRLVEITDQGRVKNLATLGQKVEVLGEVAEGVLLRLGGSLQLLSGGAISYIGDSQGTFPAYATDDEGFVYWVGPDLSAGAKGLERAVWRAPLSTLGATSLAAQVTLGVDVAGVLAVREKQVYYVIVRDGEFSIARKNADGSGQGEILRVLGSGGSELWPSPDLRRWVVVSKDKRYWVLDFGRLQP